MGDKQINQFRKESRKKCGVLYDQILAEYGLTGKSPLGRGTYADVYLLPNRRVLRLDMGTDYTRYGHIKADTLRAVNAQRCALIPTLYFCDVRTDPLFPYPKSAPWVLVSVAEQLDIIAWDRWAEVYPTPEALANSIFQGVQTLMEAGILHADISHKNVPLTPAGLRFVDLDNACMDTKDPVHAPTSVNCISVVHGTEGFVAPEFQRMQKNLFLYRGLTLDQQRDMYRKNLMYAAGALIYYVLSNTLPPAVLTNVDILPEPVRTWVADAINPDVEKRKMHLGRIAMCFSKSKPSSAASLPSAATARPPVAAAARSPVAAAARSPVAAAARPPVAAAARSPMAAAARSPVAAQPRRRTPAAHPAAPEPGVDVAEMSDYEAKLYRKYLRLQQKSAS